MQVRLALRNPDFTTAKRIAAAINDFLGGADRRAADPVDRAAHHAAASSTATWSRSHRDRAVAGRARPRRQGGHRRALRRHRHGRDVRVSTVAVAQGNLTVTVAETPQVSQPQPFSRGRTVVVPRTRVGVQEDGKKLAVVKEGVSLQQLVDGLNALGIGPRDMIAILQAIKAAGAIQAEIEVM